jgi:hypothetical protein
LAKDVREPVRIRSKEKALAFVAVWALFGIEFIRRHPKDVVALNADTMDIA